MSLRSGRVRTAPAATFAPAVDAEPSAAQRLWSISEIKLRILEFLCTGDLLRVLRTHKKGMSDVQAPYRRAQLAIVDFNSVDIAYPRQLRNLLYRVDGKPIRRGRTRGIAWSAQAGELETILADPPPSFDSIQEEVDAFAIASARLTAMSSKATPQEMLDHAQQILYSIEDAKGAAEEARDVLEVIVEKSSVAEQEVEEYVRTLRRIVYGRESPCEGMGRWIG